MKAAILKSGFTLIEVLIAVILVGLAIASLVGANGAFTKANGAGTDLSTAEFLLEQIKELTVTLPIIDPITEPETFGAETGEILTTYDDLYDFDNKSFSPPIDARRNTLGDFSSFRQQITVQQVNPSNFEQVITDNDPKFIRVTVKIYLHSTEICSASWLRARY